MKKVLFASILLLVGLQAVAAENPWLVRGRIVGLNTQQKSDAFTGAAADSVKVSNELVFPEVDVSYFFTPNIAAELVLATPIRHKATLNGADLGSFKELPPTLLVQYHYTGYGEFKPYAGLGMTYLRTMSVDMGSLGLSLHNYGPTLQVGADYKITDRISLNADIKKIFLDVDVLSAGTKLTTLGIDPLVYGVGVGYKF